MLKSLCSLLIALAAVAVPADARLHPSPDDQLQKLIGGRVPDRPVDCINLFSSPSSQIIDGTAIVYRSGGTLYVNVPHSGADSFRRDDILVTRTFGTRLCSIDTVHLVDRGSKFPHDFVSLGQFVPYTRPRMAH